MSTQMRLFYKCAVVLCLGILIYSNSFHNSFHFDDYPEIVNNAAIKNLADWQKIFDSGTTRFVTYYSFAVNYHYGDLDVFGYHVVSLLIHVGVSFLVWRLTLFIADPWTAFFAALIFLSHPVQTQPVNYIYQRSELLLAFFYLGSLIFYIKARIIGNEAPRSQISKYCYAASLVMMVLSLFCKETAVSLPLSIFLYELYFLRNRGGFKWQMVLPFFTIPVLLPLVWFRGDFEALTHLKSTVEQYASGMSVEQYFLTQLKVVVTYIQLLFIPVHQTVEYDYPWAKSFFELPVILSSVFLGLVLTGAVKLYKRFPVMSFGIFWFFITLLPDSSFWPNHDVIFEHRLYLPMAGFSILMASALGHILKDKKILIGVSVLLVALYSMMTFQRNKVWRDELSLWDDAVRKSPQSARAHLNRGAAYQKRGDLDRALADYNMAIGLGSVSFEVLSNRGAIFRDKGEFDLALANFNLAIKSNSGYVGTYVNRAKLYQMEGRVDLARQDFDRAIALAPHDVGSYVMRGSFYVSIGDFNDAVADYKTAIMIQPHNPVIYGERASIYYQIKDYEKCWQDVHTVEALGSNIKSEYLQALRQASGREN